MENKNTPYVLEVEAGTYYWCSCGQSKNLPRCDGSHTGTEFTPIAETITEKKTVAVCACGKTKNEFNNCDGSHKNI